MASLSKLTFTPTLPGLERVQGQEVPAERTLDRYIKEGGWVFLDNVHLMQVGFDGVKAEVTCLGGWKGQVHEA